MQKRKKTMGEPAAARRARRFARLLVPALTVPPLLGLAGCGAPAPAAEDLWQAAMADAVFSEDGEVLDLVALTPEDPEVIWDQAGERVLLLTWHDYSDPCAPGDPLPEGCGDVWATSLGEMEAWYAENGAGAEDWDLRFAQLLGMPEEAGCTRFTAFWAFPEDVIRPAYITDPAAQMENGYALVPEGDYKDWFDGNILWSYFESEYPWTRLGYTYDWSGGESEYGLTEFLLRDAGNTEILFTDTTAGFVSRLADAAGDGEA